ncbi:putative 1-acyl-sn-glycerol-3-phosphate acyltransferase acl-12 [Ditylenchus destructor]|uniref:1-acyl-sn-glycerol-3-phosphate acyltransferase acl-12 n=1 Tax=Ditylenchus destructor TaxID=166010 RepID=A0AAD4QSM0_9BILA|nr:putative 1-acyl-sn-glycerol-3-phosphate acyltransferase acl-12 [Ditylenchus destructor]
MGSSKLRMVSGSQVESLVPLGCNLSSIDMEINRSRLFLIQDAEKAYCKKFGLTPFRNCAHPRSSAAFAVLSECSELNPETKDAPVEYVIDCTLGYPKGVVAGLGEAMIGEWPNDTTTVAIHYKVHKVKREWTKDEAKLKEWLCEQYKAKNSSAMNRSTLLVFLCVFALSEVLLADELGRIREVAPMYVYAFFENLFREGAVFLLN